MRLRLAGWLLLLIAAFLTSNFFRPVPAVPVTAAVRSQSTTAGTVPGLPWPKGGSAAVAVSGLGMLANSGSETAMPAASVAKVMTALLVLEDKPLKRNEQGPSILITDQDVRVYQADKADQQSVVEVTAGEQLSEFQALEGLLIPSANNFATTRANWNAGSADKFVATMNKRAKDLGLNHTTFADSPGASPPTLSPPTALLALPMPATNQ